MTAVAVMPAAAPLPVGTAAWDRAAVPAAAATSSAAAMLVLCNALQ